MKIKIITLLICFLFLISYLLPLGCSKRENLNGKDIFFENIFSGYNDLIFAKSTRDKYESLFALNYKNGLMRWKFSVSEVESFDFIGISKNLIILKIRTTLLSALIALDCTNGNLVWKFDFNKNDRELDIIDALISPKENKLFIITTTDDPNNLKNFIYSIDLITGRMEFKKNLPSCRLVDKSYLYDDLLILRTRDGYNATFSISSGEISWIDAKLFGSIYSYPIEINGLLYGTGGFIKSTEIFVLDPKSKKVIRKINGAWEKANDGLFISDHFIFYYQKPSLNVYDLITQTIKMNIEFPADYLSFTNAIITEKYILLSFKKTFEKQVVKDSIVCVKKETGKMLWEYDPMKGGEIENIKLIENNHDAILIKYASCVFNWQRGEKVEEEGEIAVIDIKSGRYLWKRSYSNLRDSFNFLFLWKERIFVVDFDGNLKALNSKNGKIKWKILSLKR